MSPSNGTEPPLIFDHDPSRALSKEVVDGKTILIDQDRRYELFIPRPLKEVGMLQSLVQPLAMQLGFNDPTGKCVAMECVIPLNETATSVLGRYMALGMLKWNEKMYPCLQTEGTGTTTWHFTVDDRTMSEAGRILRTIAPGKTIGSLIVLGKVERGGFPGMRMPYIRSDRLIPVGKGLNWQRYLSDIGTAIAQTADVIFKLQNAGLLTLR